MNKNEIVERALALLGDPDEPNIADVASEYFDQLLGMRELEIDPELFAEQIAARIREPHRFPLP